MGPVALGHAGQGALGLIKKCYDHSVHSLLKIAVAAAGPGLGSVPFHFFLPLEGHVACCAVAFVGLLQAVQSDLAKLASSLSVPLCFVVLGVASCVCLALAALIM